MTLTGAATGLCLNDYPDLKGIETSVRDHLLATLSV